MQNWPPDCKTWRLLKAGGGTPGMWKDMAFCWHSRWGANAVSGLRQLPLDYAGGVKYVFDEPYGILRAYPANLPQWGAPQEPARTNICVRSQELDNTSSAWTHGTVDVTANNAVAPDATTTAEKIASSTDGTSRHIQQSSLTTTNAVWCFSIFVKQGNLPLAEIGLYDVSASGFIHRVTFTYATKALATTNGSGGSGYQELANGWFRIWVTGTFPAIGSDRVYFYHGGTGATVTGDYTYAWGAQVEAGSYPTSYIPTTTAGVARSADALRLIDANLFGPLANEGSLLWVGEWNDPAVGAATPAQVALNLSNSLNNVVGLYCSSGAHRSTIYRGNSTNTLASTNGFPTGPYARMCTWKTGGNLTAYNLGVQTAQTALNSTLQGLDRMEVGGLTSADARGGHWTYCIAAFDRELQPHEARALTSNPEALKWAS